MNRTIRAITGVILVLIITFSAINIFQDVGKSVKIDITDEKIYTLSDGTKAILAKLSQPIKIRLYYAETAALKGPDQIRFFNNYYLFVRELLEEYESYAGGMLDFEVVDPRPFSDEETEALRHRLQRFRITEEENFFFGLVLQTQFGVDKTIPFFSPQRQNFIEYDISYLIDTAVTRQKSRLGIMSSLPVMGDDVTPYMAQMMRMQGQTPKPAWTIISQLKEKYEVTNISANAEKIEDVDMLLVIHPKQLPEKTLFAIDQFIVKGGRTILCVDPYCYSDRPTQQQMQMGMTSQASDLNLLLRNWGLQVPANTFAGDRSLALDIPTARDGQIQKHIGFLGLTNAKGSFGTDSVVTVDLNMVRLLFSGVINEVDSKDADITKQPILITTNRGNEWSISNPYELMSPDFSGLMRKFRDGAKPVVMGYQITGKLKSAFPEGIDIPDETAAEGEEKTKKVTGTLQADQECVVTVYADVDFISDIVAYQDSFFGMKAMVGDNATLMLNTVDDLTGSSDLISIRSRGTFARPFIVVDEIEEQAEAETALEVAKINSAIEGFQKELQEIISSTTGGQESMLETSIIEKRRELELKIHEQQRNLREVKKEKREKKESLGNILRAFNMLLAPAVILTIAIVLSIFRNARKRHYIGHAID